jgi:hypothetical protein
MSALAGGSSPAGRDRFTGAVAGYALDGATVTAC